MAFNSLGMGNKLRISFKLARLKQQQQGKSIRLIYAAASSKWIQNHRRAAGKKCFSSVSPNIVKSDFPDIEIPNVPIHEIIFKDLPRWENKVAIECGETGKTWTYKDLFRFSKNLAASLQKKLKLGKGDFVGAVLPNCPEFLSILLAGSMTGVVPSTINPIYTATEISALLKDTKPSAIFTTTQLHDKCVESLKLTDLKIPIVTVKFIPNAETPAGAISFDELIANSSGDYLEPKDFDYNLDFVLPFSSGTSGLPKGVQLSHKNVSANVIQLLKKPKFESTPEKETNQRFILGLLPMFHIYGMVVVCLYSLVQGDKIISLPRFEPKSFVEMIWKKKVQSLYAVPPIIFFLANQPWVESKHLESVQSIMNGAAPCGAKDVDKLLEKSNRLVFTQGYGLTETAPVITLTDINRIEKITSIGSLLPSCIAKIVDVETGEILPEGKSGELCVQGPNVMKGYYNRPEENEKAFDSDKWFKTGDIAYFDKNKDFFIVDRMKELIKVKGFQVAPAELEEFLRSHKKVSDAGVIGVQHPQYGEVPKAFIALKENVECTEEEIQEFVKESLSPHKQLKGGVTFLKMIPRSSAGKILRKDLKLMESKS